MKKKTVAYLCVVAVALISFAVWTALVRLVDVQAIGPQSSSVGFASLNGAFHRLTGVHLSLYTLTDWLSLLPLGAVLCFAALGLTQWIGRKHLLRVDPDLLALGVFYAVVMAVYLLFECVVINYRPVMLSGSLEVSYPSSTTMLVLCVMPTVIAQLNRRVKHVALRRWATWGICFFTVFMVLGRILSGVHWITDIIGGILISTCLVSAYLAACELLDHPS